MSPKSQQFGPFKFIGGATFGDDKNKTKNLYTYHPWAKNDFSHFLVGRSNQQIMTVYTWWLVAGNLRACQHVVLVMLLSLVVAISRFLIQKNPGIFTLFPDFRSRCFLDMDGPIWLTDEATIWVHRKKMGHSESEIVEIAEIPISDAKSFENSPRLFSNTGRLSCSSAVQNGAL